MTETQVQTAPGGDEIEGVAREVSALAQEMGAEIERRRQLPDELVARLRTSGLLRAGAPLEVDGLQLAPGPALRCAEEIARGDASAGWCVSIAMTSSLLAAYLPAESREELFGGGRGIAAGVVDYKGGDLRPQLKASAPDGVDVFFDNVGGEILDQVLVQLARGARVVVCGAVSQYNATEAPRGPANYMQLLVSRASMTGFVIFDHEDRFGEAASQLASWLRSGELRSREDVVHGDVEQFPGVLLRLFEGGNTGKLVLALDGAQ
jgi:Zinc-binding dehydrogenase/Acyl-CoA dehydrogenase, N-terminal domain